MKIFDCTTYYDEPLLMDVRFNILNQYVEKFIVVEALFSHAGHQKKLNFDINNYKKFKDKIIYLVIDKEPTDLIVKEELDLGEKRMNSIKRIEQSYNFMQKGLNQAADEDLVIMSDNDEIPNLNSNQFKKSKKKVIIFQQLFFYYKFNLFFDKMLWHGSKACKKKSLISFSWLRNIKNKIYPAWRLDRFFSKYKLSNLEIIKDGGWHFTNLKTPEDLYKKSINGGHHNEFESSGITLEEIKKKIQNHELIYDHFLDKSDPNKHTSNYKLQKIKLDLLPSYIKENQSSFKDWIV